MSIWQKLMNKLFGWHYVALRYGFDIEVFRVIQSPSGKLFAKCYGHLEPLNVRPYEPLTWVESKEADDD